MTKSHSHIIGSGYRTDIDGLRGICILAVLGFHAFPSWVSGGYVGVDIFFVISGYLISLLIIERLKNSRFSLLNFYIRRVVRIFPSLIVILLFSIIFGWISLVAPEYENLGLYVAGASIFADNFIAWHQSGYFDPHGNFKPLMHLWSLGIEEQFYIIWPLLTLILYKKNIYQLAILVVIAISFGLCVQILLKDPDQAFYSPWTRFWELGVGSYLAYAQTHQSFLGLVLKRLQSIKFNLSNLSDVIGIGGIILVGIGAIFFSKDTSFPGVFALIPVVGALLLLISGPTSWVGRKVLSNPILIWFGVISYPLYLWHWVLISYLRIIVGNHEITSLTFIVIAISVLLSWVTYKYIERPIRSGSINATKFIGLIALMTILGLVGYKIYLMRGIEVRSADATRKANQFGWPIYRQGCENLTGEKFANDWCNLGSSERSPPNILVVGDSFANSFSGVFQSLELKSQSKFSYIQFGRGECPMLLGYGPDSCALVLKKSIDYMFAHKSIDTVVIAMNWRLYYKNKSYINNLNENEKSFSTAFKKTVKLYRENGKRVVVILAPPGGLSPKQCFVRPFSLTEMQSCNISRSDADAIERSYRSWLLPLLIEQKIDFFDPFRYMCNEEVCFGSYGDKILYLDDSHLSANSGDFLVERASKSLNELFLLKQ